MILRSYMNSRMFLIKLNTSMTSLVALVSLDLTFELL